MIRPQIPVIENFGFGLGLRPCHYGIAKSGQAKVDWFEVVTENFLSDGGLPLLNLEKIRSRYPVFFHGVSGNLGSTDPLNKSYLKKVKKLISQFQPSVVSDHLCWTGVEGQNLHDLMPLPYTEEALDHVATRISQVQDFLGRQILIENVSSYLDFSSSEMTEWDFIKNLIEKADCGLLLDVNNIYVSSVNHGFDPKEFISALPSHRIGQIHLAGHSTIWNEDGKKYLIDTHDHDVCDDVWELYRYTISVHGEKNTMIERDARIPSFKKLRKELERAIEISKDARSTNTTKIIHGSSTVEPKEYQLG